LILDWPRWLATAVVEGTEATVVDAGVVVVVEGPVSLVLTLQLLVEAAGDFRCISGLSAERFLSKTFLSSIGPDIPHRASEEGMEGVMGDRLTFSFIFSV
jgi:hypothetical protein